jgi:hypothetical protein
MRVNARGDELGEDNLIVRNNNERVAEYYTAQHPAQESAAPPAIIEESLPQLLENPKADSPLIVDKPKRKEKTDV